MHQPARVGFVGCPPYKERARLTERFKEVEWIDLDNFHPQSERFSAEILPSNVCAIVKRIVDNAMSMPLDSILFDQGYGKCDHARAVATILEKRLSIPVVHTRNHNLQGQGTPICDSGLPLIEKAEQILQGLSQPASTSDVDGELSHSTTLSPVQPQVALWGVPASDFRLYRLFPDGTRLIGWFRCLENRTPADESLELEVDPQVPTIFFAQTFCHKNLLAKELANTYQGLYVDMDGSLTASVQAKVETFLSFHTQTQKR